MLSGIYVSFAFVHEAGNQRCVEAGDYIANQSEVVIRKVFHVSPNLRHEAVHLQIYQLLKLVVFSPFVSDAVQQRNNPFFGELFS